MPSVFPHGQDICGVLGEGSEYGDSGIDGVTAEMDGDGELVSRRCKAMSASFSVYSAAESSVFNGSDSGSSSAGGGDGRGGEGGRGGVYENFRKELDNQAWVSSTGYMYCIYVLLYSEIYVGEFCSIYIYIYIYYNIYLYIYMCINPQSHGLIPVLVPSQTQGRDCTEDVGSAVSDEQSSGTLSSAFPSDTLIGCAQGTVRKAGALAVKNFLVHKKNKKVEPATRRKWKHYWVSLKGDAPKLLIFLSFQSLLLSDPQLFSAKYEPPSH